ncbi:hypothetical protein D9611_013913 [Ephemerocybe angulata]|uniref:F-box domain-containing protein n=1 Tax=Ephemerocybe angulata TaxID=980116 RepID=A0A8H5EZX3_9AGAR|nr:hypothetical protein D9611_013913 [Tulosesus angulatus]
MPELPDDVYLAIFNYLNLGDIPSIRTVNKKFLQLTQAGSLWRQLLRGCIIEEGLPIPGIRDVQLDRLQGQEIEGLVRRALELRANWTSPFPVAREAVNFKGSPSGRIIFLRFLKRPGRLWLLSLCVHGDPTARLYTLECWDLAGPTPTPPCIARKTFTQLVSIAENRGWTPEAGIGDVAIQGPSITVYSIRASPADPELGFLPVATFPERREYIHLFSGTKMLTTLANSEKVHTWDTRSPSACLELLRPRREQQQTTTLANFAATFDGRFITVVWPTTCNVYEVPTAQLKINPTSLVLEPIQEFVWPWRVDNVVMSQAPSQLFDCDGLWRPRTINILIRFGSGYPWPINLLHQFELLPNTRYRGDAISIERPYRFPPTSRQTIASPVRLFAQTDMAVGPYGTAVWIDSHTEDQFGPAEQAQRLASRVTRPTALDWGNEEQFDDIDEQEEISNEIASTLDASLVLWNEGDSWLKLAIDEEEGKIALGRLDGTITLLSFT